VKVFVDRLIIFNNLNYSAGVVETGLFVGMACKAYFGMADGSVSTI
jgi:ribose 5-phosphate isomerase